VSQRNKRFLRSPSLGDRPFSCLLSSPETLKTAVLRALHDHELATSAGGVAEADLVARAPALLPRPHGIGTAQLVLAVAGGPHQQVMRPPELEDPRLARDVQRDGLFGDHPVLDPSEGTTTAIQGNALVLDQRVASVLIDQAGSVRVVHAARQEADRRQTELPALIQEDVVQALVRAVRFSGWFLDRVDPLHRLTDVVVIAHLAGAGYMPWRTRAEHAASPSQLIPPFLRREPVVRVGHSYGGFAPTPPSVIPRSRPVSVSTPTCRSSTAP
jgi:hypothetical protein